MMFNRFRIAVTFVAFAAVTVVAACTDADKPSSGGVVLSAAYAPGQGFSLTESDRSLAAELGTGGELFVQVDDGIIPLLRHEDAAPVIADGAELPLVRVTARGTERVGWLDVTASGGETATARLQSSVSDTEHPEDVFQATGCANGTYRFVVVGVCHLCYCVGGCCVSSNRYREQYCAYGTWYNTNTYRCGSI